MPSYVLCCCKEVIPNLCCSEEHITALYFAIHGFCALFTANYTPLWIFIPMCLANFKNDAFLFIMVDPQALAPNLGTFICLLMVTIGMTIENVRIISPSCGCV
ncbi:hypothetical protein KQX54_018375 [Cotesia glomerata]|uniref:Olfactory receptor n=1 Tax=Cotesia glomerata TaxID=32391 RepID=A0AAV7I7N5_COTGL|nr:hypothetical protein KQX54_018375 [Cotesia glomerata]